MGQLTSEHFLGAEILVKMGNKQGQTLMCVKTSENVNRDQTKYNRYCEPRTNCLVPIHDQRVLALLWVPSADKTRHCHFSFVPSFLLPGDWGVHRSPMTQIVKKSFPLRNFHQPTVGRTDFLQAAFQGLFPICRVPSHLQACLLVQGWRISDWHLPEWFCGYKPNLPVIRKWHRKTKTKTRSCKVPSTTWNVAGILGIYVSENFTSPVPAIKCLHVHLLQYFTWENEWNQR